MKWIMGLILLLASGLAWGEDVKVTIHVDDSYKPFSYSEDGEVKGMYIKVLQHAFSRMEGFEVKLRAVPWNRGKLMMEKGEGFGLAPAFFHGHDWPYLYPYSLPFYTETIIAVCAEEVLNPPRHNWPENYKGLKIGNVAGFDGWGGEEFRAMVQRGEINYEEAKGSAQNILKLGKGRIDCIMMEDKAFDYTFRKLKQAGQYDEGGKHIQLKKGAIIGTDPVYIGYSAPARKAGKIPYQMEFMQAFDSEIYKMIKANEISKIMDTFEE